MEDPQVEGDIRTTDPDGSGVSAPADGSGVSAPADGSGLSAAATAATLSHETKDAANACH
jgi:hypothetical protein